ncbi:hypothetical protein TELCIR_20468, partial [Teladorsagia circumcincta]
LTLGVRIFITTYLFHRFPRLRKRLDTYGWFYRNLPVKTSRDGSPVLVPGTEPLLSLASRAASPVPRKNTLNPNGLFTSRLGSNFNLDTTGSQLSLNSRRNSSMQNLALKGSMQNLNQNFKIRSLRTVGLLTGTRKSLEIRMEGRRKALQFIGLAQRDDFYSRIQIVSGNDSNIEFL